jgi:hypothetical protein
MNPHKRKISAVVTLFFVAPFIAEYLLGDLPLKMLAALMVLAPTYGGAAVLIRETARRSGRDWPTMLLLGVAFALVAEGLTTQSLFNPDYLRRHLHLLSLAWIPALGVGGWWTLFMLNLHTFWSMGVSIALAEALFPAQAERPWLGAVGDCVVAAVFLLGSVVSFLLGFKQHQFVATPGQLLGAAGLSVLLIVAAFLIPVRNTRREGGWTPLPWMTGAVAFVLGMGVLNTPPRWRWGAVAAMLAIDIAFLLLVAWLASFSGWKAIHTLSLAAGGALSYGIHALSQKPLLGGWLAMRVSNAVFLTIALWLIWLATCRVLRAQALTNR